MLCHAFTRIDSEAVRKAILALVKSMATSDHSLDGNSTEPD